MLTSTNISNLPFYPSGGIRGRPAMAALVAFYPFPLSDILTIQPLRNSRSQVFEPKSRTPAFCDIPISQHLFCWNIGAEGAAIMAGKSLNRVQLIGNLGKDP